MCTFNWKYQLLSHDVLRKIIQATSFLSLINYYTFSYIIFITSTNDAIFFTIRKGQRHKNLWSTDVCLLPNFYISLYEETKTDNMRI